jgi:hypothetical protein
MRYEVKKLGRPILHISYFIFHTSYFILHISKNCLVAQLVAHRSDTARVGGSNPFETTVAVACWFADKNVALVDTGSIPVSHPDFKLKIKN